MVFWGLVGILTAATLVVALALRVVRRRSIERPGQFWRRVLGVHVLLVLLHMFVTVPLTMGYMGSRWVGTRRDERAYAGPRVEGAEWRLQNRHSLAEGEASASPFAVELDSLDGVPLRGFRVDPVGEPRVAMVLVHGLFRGAVELEPVGAMFRRHGAAILMLELRNHGGSARAPFTGGRDESLDVEAGLRWMAGEYPELPLAVFGVSLGTAAVALAAPRVDGLAGVFLDAPMDDLARCADRFFAKRSFLGVVEPFQSLVLRSLELWSGFRLEDVRPADALAALPETCVVQLVAEGDDSLMPLASIERIAAALPQPESRRRLWVCEGAPHGRAWLHAPGEYRDLVGAFCDALVTGR